MKYVLTSGEMSQCDKNTMEYYGVISPVLMERAALACAAEIEAAAAQFGTEILIVCGTGNNGGDGLAAARLLYLKGYHVTVLYPGDEQKASPEGARQLAIVRRYGIPVVTELSADAIRPFDVIVDGLFGIGLCREIGGKYRPLIDSMNAADAYRIAIDISSGIRADDGAILGTAFLADLTVTFGFAKVGQLVYPGAEYTGRLVTADIGIDEYSLLDIHPQARMMEQADLELLAKRPARSNKGTYGKILIAAGSKNMGGAAVFAAKAAYWAGAGLVRVLTHEKNREVLLTAVPEAVLSVYDDDTELKELVQEACAWADVIAAGPGLGTSAQAEQLMKELLAAAEVPVLIDADGLNLLAGHKDWLRPDGAYVFTPHPGEMSRLTGRTVSDITSSMVSSARSAAEDYHAVVVLKDARTVIAAPGGQLFINTSGNQGMATGGSGDVLTGLTAALLYRAEDLLRAAALGVYLHGLSGDRAALWCGYRSMTASDLIDGLRGVLSEYELEEETMSNKGE